MAHRTSTSPPPPDGGRKPGAQPAPQRRRLRSRQAHGALGAVGRGSGGWGQSGAGAWGRKEGQRVPHQPGVSPPTALPSTSIFSARCAAGLCVGSGPTRSSLGTEEGPATLPARPPPYPPAWFLFWTPAPGPHQPHRCSGRRGTSQLLWELQGCWGRGPGAGLRLRTAVSLPFLIKPLTLWPRQGC